MHANDANLHAHTIDALDMWGHDPRVYLRHQTLGSEKRKMRQPSVWPSVSNNEEIVSGQANIIPFLIHINN